MNKVYDLTQNDCKTVFTSLAEFTLVPALGRGEDSNI